MTHEIRIVSVKVEARATEDSEKRTLSGYAIVYDSPTLIGDEAWGFTEVIARGAADEAIKGDVVALVSHDRARVLGRTTSGTLRLKSDEHGVAVEIDLPDTTDGRDMFELVSRGDISGMSFAFNPTKQVWDESVQPPKRTITEMEVLEVSAVAFPAYEDTELKARAKVVAEELRSKAAAEKSTEQAITTEDSPAQPVSRAAPNIRARLSMDLDLRVRTTR